jgi:pyridoxal 5'-phosphate synthase pdxT subunit
VSEESPLVGVLALQGGFEAHEKVIARLGGRTRQVRVPADLEGLDALILPGGESTTMTLGVEREDLGDPLRAFAASGKPILGTCAGMIMLDQAHLGILDGTTKRNAFGRQLYSFEADFEVEGIPGGPLHAIFIRAPWMAQRGPKIHVLAEVDGNPVAVRQDNILALSFHPELTGEDRVHRLFLSEIAR